MDPAQSATEAPVSSPATEALEALISSDGFPDEAERAAPEPAAAQPVVPADDDAPEPVVAAPNRGVQSRIDELTAARREAERKANELQSQMIAMQAQTLQAMQRAMPAPAPSPQDLELQEALAEMDPRQRRVFEHMLEQRVGPLQNTVAAFREQAALAEMQAERNKYSPETQQLADRLMANWKANGNTGWLPKDALVHAAGMVFSNGGDPRASAVQPKRRSATAAVLPAASAPSADIGASPRGDPAYTDMDSPEYNPSKASAYFEKKLEGKPIF